MNNDVIEIYTIHWCYDVELLAAWDSIMVSTRPLLNLSQIPPFFHFIPYSNENSIRTLSSNISFTIHAPRTSFQFPCRSLLTLPATRHSFSTSVKTGAGRLIWDTRMSRQKSLRLFVLFFEYHEDELIHLFLVA